MKETGLGSLFRFKGYSISEIIFSEDVVEVNLVCDRRFGVRCPSCGGAGFVEAAEHRSARDLPVGRARLVYLHYPARKFRCRNCGRRTWLTPKEIDSRKGASHRLMRYAAYLSCYMPVSRASDLLNVVDTRLRRWDKAVLKDHLGTVVLDDLRVLLVDEKAIGKRHQYVTMVLNADTGELLHCHEGKKKESLSAFFHGLSEEQKSTIEVVCIDRAGSYMACIEEELPKAAIAYDRFHLVKNLNDVIGELRKDEYRRLLMLGDEDGAKLIKSQLYNLLRRPENNTPGQQGRLDQLLKMNEPLYKAYLLLEDFRDALSQTFISHAKGALQTWIHTARESGIQRIVRFAEKISKATDRIVNAVRYKVSNGLLEGFNNLVGRVIHRGCGYKDMQYLKLKLRQAAMPDELKVPWSQN